MKRKLNMWQRLGIVASMLWIAGCVLSERYYDLNKAQEMKTSAYSICISYGHTSLNCEERAVALYNHFNQTVQDHLGPTIAIILAPLILAWLLAYVGVWLSRWVWAGRTEVQ
jgi:hypothetical protein